MNIKDLLNEFSEANIKIDEPLSKYTYTKTGGPADALIFPKSKEEVQALMQWLNANNWPVTILGNASNLIVKDGGIRGATIILTDMNKITIENKTIRVLTGAPLIEVSKRAYDAELTGLEFACGIPGSVGGAIYMNAGAYGGEVREVIKKVTLLTRKGVIKEMANEDMDFDYRHSILQESDDIALEVVFELKDGNPEKIKEKMDELTYLRTSKQPLEYPSCGSVFKRPTGYFTGKLIQDAGLQGYILGGAQVSKKHAGFIVNIDNATASDYIELIAHIKEIILEKDGVTLETEVKIIGNDVTREKKGSSALLNKAKTSFKSKLNQASLADETLN
ncbi:MAG: UDP-N-acetylmuramate dehydrogenase [Alkalibacterium gilvum]|uniref:UDP-N-acetylenolpyruvoylglucosamine reductase n=1 Tax=Alkalibacterium gilvum TaxID=1130080 RepID=A0A1H6UFK1_9LACT|nr:MULTISPECIES: UDP-N-acetylmuramate dehydrogenase [Alkalibacterium]MDN6292985.1 UDP-N-acetylmuramate dehydrogenase [Alkalibacterium sp.]MDN6295213.1 UDP-N-acetylmuramate dehydrogenase [Alkalibacterium sp.]MDN6385604.1 UDP-N-acetylmuramate dehydrogenase [Alkalibacterium sp.]MDN6398622.1 UDP-N-acetylmuramate dehydrogenase [Alkalibacterium sp.]MDN6729657.1 UDP-N-acetylmuramate dehydrogenase [Alkalibacterium sp.]